MSYDVIVVAARLHDKIFFLFLFLFSKLLPHFAGTVFVQSKAKSCLIGLVKFYSIFVFYTVLDSSFGFTLNIVL